MLEPDIASFARGAWVSLGVSPQGHSGVPLASTYAFRQSIQSNHIFLGEVQADFGLPATVEKDSGESRKQWRKTVETDSGGRIQVKTRVKVDQLVIFCPHLPPKPRTPPDPRVHPKASPV